MLPCLICFVVKNTSTSCFSCYGSPSFSLLTRRLASCQEWLCRQRRWTIIQSGSTFIIRYEIIQSRVKICNGHLCTLLPRLSAFFCASTLRNRRLQSGTAVAHRSLSSCKRTAVASPPITQTSRSVWIKSDLLSHQTSPAACGRRSALKPETHSLSQGDSKTQHTCNDILCFLGIFLQPQCRSFPPPQNLRGGRFERACPRESLSFRPGASEMPCGRPGRLDRNAVAKPLFMKVAAEQSCRSPDARGTFHQTLTHGSEWSELSHSNRGCSLSLHRLMFKTLLSVVILSFILSVISSEAFPPEAAEGMNKCSF